MPRKIYEEVKREVKMLPRVPYALTTADGGKIEIQRTCLAMIKMGKHSRETELQVVDNLLQDYIILGADFMAKNKVVMDMGKRHIRMGQPEERETSGENGEQYKLHICSSLSLEPEMEGVLRARCPEATSKDLLVEAIELPQNVLALPGIDTLDAQNEIGVHVVNVGPDSISLNRKNIMAIGTVFHAIDGIELEKAEQELRKRKHRRPDAESGRYVEQNAQLGMIPRQWKQAFLDVLKLFPGVYARSHLDVGDCPVLPHRIEITDPSQVVNIAPYRVPHHLQKIQHSYVDELLAAKVIRPSNSPWSSPIMMVRKGNADPKLPLSSQFRAVHNYKRVNSLIHPPSYPLSNLYQLLDEVAGKKVFSVLDLSQGYFNQRCIDPHGATAFNVPGRGTFEYVKSPMGINSSPSNFQRLTEYIIRGIPSAYVYLDDIIIATMDYDSHLKTLKEVLERLQHYDLRINLRKAHFGKESVTYLGYQISNNEIKPGERKTKAISEAKPPTSVRQIKQFLGLCSFFRKTIPRFSEIAAPLNKLVRKASTYESGQLPEEALQAFRQLQRSLSQRPCLTPVDFDQEFIVTIDTSKVAHGAILSQISKGGIEKVCAYASSLLPESKMRRPAIQLEKEGIRWALQHFRPYLLGREFLIRTDHKPLVSLAKGTVEITDSISADIQKYLPFRVEYLPGTRMPADYLSRPVCLTKRTKSAPIQEKPPLGSQLWGENNVSLSTTLLREAQQGDSAIKAIVCYLRYKMYPKDHLLKAQVNLHRQTTKINDYGLLTDKEGRIMIPNSLKHEIMLRSHDEMGHRNALTSLANSSRYFFWDTMKRDFEKYVKGCTVCNKSKPGYGPHHTLLGQFPPAGCFNDRIHLDCITGLRRSPVTGHTAILVISDAYSNFVQAESIPSPNANSAVTCLVEKWIKHHGFPRLVVTDGGKEFDSEAFKTTCQQYQITHRTTSPGISRTNGQVERANRSLVQFMRNYIEGHKFKIHDWERLLPAFCINHNYSKQQNGFSPHFLVYGNYPNLNHLNPEPELTPYREESWVDRLNLMAATRKALLQWKRQAQSENERQFNKTYHPLTLQAGDLVYHRVSHDKYGSKLNRKFVGPFIVLRTTKSSAYITILGSNGTPFWCHKDRLKKSIDQQKLLQRRDEPNSDSSSFSDPVDAAVDNGPHDNGHGQHPDPDNANPEPEEHGAGNEDAAQHGEAEREQEDETSNQDTDRQQQDLPAQVPRQQPGNNDTEVNQGQQGREVHDAAGAGGAIRKTRRRAITPPSRAPSPPTGGQVRLRPRVELKRSSWNTLTLPSTRARKKPDSDLTPMVSDPEAILRKKKKKADTPEGGNK